MLQQPKRSISMKQFLIPFLVLAFSSGAFANNQCQKDAQTEYESQMKDAHGSSIQIDKLKAISAQAALDLALSERSDDLDEVKQEIIDSMERKSLIFVAYSEAQGGSATDLVFTGTPSSPKDCTALTIVRIQEE